MSLIISYKEFAKNLSSIIFNYDHSQIKIGQVWNRLNNYIKLGYSKDKNYDTFIIEATNDDIESFNAEPCQGFCEHDPYIKLKNYNSILDETLTNIIKPIMTEINNKNHYYKKISYHTLVIDEPNLYRRNKKPIDIPIIYYKSNIGIKLINLDCDLLNVLVKHNNVKVQLELICKMITPWDSFTDNSVQLYMNVKNISIFKNPEYDDSLLMLNTITNNTIDFEKSIYSFDNILNELEDDTFNFQEKVVDILKYFGLKYSLKEDYSYFLKNRCYIIGEDTEFTNMTIIFDERFSRYDITETIKQEFSKINIRKNDYYMNDIFFIEKERNKKYVIVYSNDYRYGYGGDEIIEIFKLYTNILKMIVNICDINKYTIKFDETYIPRQNKYNIINITLNNYVHKNYSKINDELLNKIFEKILSNKYDDFDYNYVNACIAFKNGVICFQDKALKAEFEKEIKKNNK